MLAASTVSWDIVRDELSSPASSVELPASCEPDRLPFFVVDGVKYTVSDGRASFFFEPIGA